MLRGVLRTLVPAIAALTLLAVSAAAQTVKIGVILTYSGPFAQVGDEIDKGLKLYIKEHEKELPAGVKLELVVRDDTGPNPDVAKRLAQELITRDQVQLLTGVVDGQLANVEFETIPNVKDPWKKLNPPK